MRPPGDSHGGRCFLYSRTWYTVKRKPADTTFDKYPQVFSIPHCSFVPGRQWHCICLIAQFNSVLFFPDGNRIARIDQKLLSVSGRQTHLEADTCFQYQSAEHASVEVSVGRTFIFLVDIVQLHKYVIGHEPASADIQPVYG